MLEILGLLAGNTGDSINTLEGYVQCLLKLNMHLLYDPASTYKIFFSNICVYIHWKIPIARLRVELISYSSNMEQPNAVRMNEFNVIGPPYITLYSYDTARYEPSWFKS